MPMTFQQALAESGNIDKTVLLGNGFSIAGHDVFNYKRLIERAQQREQIADYIMRVFDGLNTFDFEIVIEQLNNSADIIDLFSDDHQKLSAELRDTAVYLQDTFANLIVTEHAAHGEVFTMMRDGSRIWIRDCAAFLRNFNQVFTTNYDLLLYWAINRELRSGNTSLFDGFGWSGDSAMRIYIPERQQNVFYLHGSLFLQQRGMNTFKIIHDGRVLLDIIRNNVREGIMPLIILEGDSDSKSQRISEHAYLSGALNALSSLTGDLYIHGHSLDINDQHIFDRISSNQNIRKIFVSAISGNDVGAVLQDKDASSMYTIALQRFNTRSSNEIRIYDGRSANVWR